MTSTNFTEYRDQLTDALRALDVAVITDPELDATDAALVLTGALTFRLADLACTAIDDTGTDIGTHGIRARFSRGWNDVRAGAECTTSTEAATLSVFCDLIRAAVHDNAVKEQNPYAKAASFALEAAAALLYLATDTDPGNPVEGVSRAGARAVADDRLTHAHAWLAHLRSAS
jgi:hypothetical protein